MAGRTEPAPLSASDRADISGLLFAYAERLDAGDLDGVAALFARAKFDSTSGDRAEPLSGAEQIRRMYDPVLLYSGTPRTRHLITNVIIEACEAGEAGEAAEAGGMVAGAHSRCSFTVLQAAPGGALGPILAGRYHDDFQRFADGWWFTRRLVLPDLRGNLRLHFGQP